MKKKTFLIAEAGVNHNGDEALAIDLIDIAADCGADAVKFQTFRADKLVRPGTEKAEYQKLRTGTGDQHSMLHKLEISEELHQKLKLHCTRVGIEFMSTPFDEESADFLTALGIKHIKVPSGEVTNHPFLRHLAKKNLPIILSTGMASMAEVLEAVEVIRHTRVSCNYTQPLEQYLTLLHCTSNYPADPVDINLLAMNTMREMTGLPVGYSDHTAGISVSVAAVALGAQVIEKHFTSNRTLPGPDHCASLEPKELKTLIAQIREIELALGSSEKKPTNAELSIRNLVRRSVTTARALSAGQELTFEDLILLRPGNGIPPKDLDKVVGLHPTRALPAGHTLSWNDLT